MDVRFGSTLDGRAVGFDTSSTRPLLLLGDAGRGKTTLARYLTRWWLADTTRHAHIASPAISEWSDLCCVHLDRCLSGGPTGTSCPPGTCLVVVDNLDRLDEVRLSRAPTARLIVTTQGYIDNDAHLLLSSIATCLGLVRAESSDPTEAALLDGQGRLDWPAETDTVIPDPRASLDFPCHRWHPASHPSTDRAAERAAEVAVDRAVDRRGDLAVAR